MNADKAREHFSDYYEGTMDRGLLQSFERKLQSDPDVQAEYRAFELTMKELEVPAAPVPEPDFDLHERISARLDRYVYENKAKPAAWFLGRRRTVWVTAFCALAILGAGTQIGRGTHTGDGGFLSTVFPILGSKTVNTVGNQVSVSIRNGKPVLTVVTGEKQTVTVRSATTGSVLRSETLDGAGLPAGARMRSELNYDAERSTLVEVLLSGSESKWLIALPGTTGTVPNEGHGTIRDLALALATRYQTVVVVAKDGSSPVKWTLGDDPVAAATDALRETDFSIERRGSGVIWIQ